MKLQFKTVYGADGEHDSPYLTRVIVGRLRLHIFHRGDEDPDPHDHPWGFWTFPLTSYEEEVTVPDPSATAIDAYITYRQVVRSFRPQYRPASHTHRVLGRVRRVGVAHLLAKLANRLDLVPYIYGTWVPVPGRIVTLVWRERTSRPWGFLKSRDGKWCWVAWRDYCFNGGKNAPCE